MTIKPADDSAGRQWNYEKLPWRPDCGTEGEDHKSMRLGFAATARTNHRCLSEAVAALAGGWAERKGTGRGRPSQADVDIAVGYCGHLSVSPETYNDWVKVANLTARALVEKHWSFVIALAEALLEHETLTGKQVREVIAAQRTERVHRPERGVSD